VIHAGDVPANHAPVVDDAMVAIADLGQRALGDTELPVLFDAAVALVASELGVEYASLWELLPDGSELLVRAGRGWRSEVLARATIPADRASQAGYALQAGEPVITADLEAEVRFDEAPMLRAWGIRSGVSVPIVVRDRPFGALSVHALRPRSFAGPEVALLRATANLLAAAVERVERDARNRALGTISRLFGESLDHEALLASVAQIMVPAFGDVCLIDEVGPDGQVQRRALGAVEATRGRQLRELIDQHPPEPRWPWPVAGALADGLVRAVAKTAPPADLVASDPEYVRRVQALGLGAALTLPLVARGRTIGALSLAFVDAQRRHTPAEVDLAQVVARRVATGLDTLRLFAAERGARQEAERALALARAAEQGERLRALGQMASGIAHDLNQSLGLVVGHAELALRALAPGAPALDEVHGSLETLLRAGLDGAATVRRLLAFARGREEGEPELLDLAALCRDVAQLTAPRWRDAAQAEGRPIRVEIDADAPVLVLGWATSVREALTNLVLNSVDALPAGGEIRLRARRAGAEAELVVADTGVGIPAAMRARVFEPFFSTKGAGGTGLGLTMVQGIVQRHGGRIEVKSRPGRGTAFRVLLPAAEAAPPVTDLPDVPAATPARVLVVDDEPELGQLAARVLEREGHDVATATSGEQALEMLARGDVDVLVSDIGLGTGMNGWELVADVRRRWPAVQVVLATGWGAAIDAKAAGARGVRAVVAKPYRAADLCRAVAAARRQPG
jgi:signal transduction histidine kinase